MLVTSSDQVVEVNFDNYESPEISNQVLESIKQWKEERHAHIDIFEISEVGKKIIINNTYKENCLLLTSHLIFNFSSHINGIIEPNSLVKWKVGKRDKYKEGILIGYIPKNLELTDLILNGHYKVPEGCTINKAYKLTSPEPRYLVLNVKNDKNHLHFVPTNKVSLKAPSLVLA